jgi:NAD(P)-dependent dehydrogenase (short-subunit alcohol dehydrogenase family)
MILNDLKGKVVLITGAATGIGQATALAFGQQGAKVVIGDVNDTGKETAELIIQQGGQAIYQKTDVTKADHIQALVDLAVKKFGGLDIAFNNAGVLPPPNFLLDTQEKDFDIAIAVDLKGVFLCMKAEIEYMKANGGGSIINTASIAGLKGFHTMSAYCAAKFGVVGLTRAAAVEYAPDKVRINCICPGHVATPMTAHWIADKEFMARLYAGVPAGRHAEPEEIAKIVLFLASDESDYMTGSAYTIDGGMNAL